LSDSLRDVCEFFSYNLRIHDKIKSKTKKLVKGEEFLANLNS